MAKKTSAPILDLSFDYRSSGNEPKIGETFKHFTPDLQQWIDNFVNKIQGLISDEQMEVLCKEICTRCQGNEPDINRALHYFNQKKLKRSVVIFNSYKNRVSFVYRKEEDDPRLLWHWVRCYL